MTSGEPPPYSLLDDPLLRDVPVVDGRKFLDPVDLTSRIGQGGMGAVYRGHHRALRMDVAVKCLKPSVVAEAPHAIERFQREARLTAQLSHQNLVRLYEFRQEHGLAYLVLEYVEGRTARKLVLGKRPLSEAAAVKVVLAAARGLAVAHRHPEGIVHRDIKPDNILISRRGEVKLADLGLAKAMERLDDSTFATDGTVGTPRYMAPEQWNPKLRPTPRTDVWALGATLYFLLTGEDALRGATLSEICGEAQSGRFPDPRDLRPELSAEVTRLVQRCTRLDPSERSADAGELARELQEFLGTRASSPTGSTAWITRAKRKPVHLAAAALAVLGISGWLIASRQDSSPVRAAQGPPQSSTPGVLDPVSKRLVPEEGWEVLDDRPGWSNWATRVRESQSGIVFRLIPPGSFWMGSPSDEPMRESDEVRHQVTITAPFYIGECETTAAQAFRIEGKGRTPERDDLPSKAPWHAARDACKWIGCTLPTEAQWEYAARGGSESMYWWGDRIEDGLGKCNVLDLSWADVFENEGATLAPFRDGYSDVAPVGSFEPNGYGLHDMTGNVREWCLDAYVVHYENLPRQDPLADPVGDVYVQRGGLYENGPDGARVADRMSAYADRESTNCGFRPVRNLR